MLQLAWGLTLNLSSESAQQNIGKIFTDRFQKLSEEYKNVASVKRYIDGVNGALSAFLRNMGYEKDFLVVELDTQEKIRDKRIENINELADMTSLSSEGLIAQIVAFF
jgi:hypothetical protein